MERVGSETGLGRKPDTVIEVGVAAVGTRTAWVQRAGFPNCISSTSSSNFLLNFADAGPIFVPSPAAPLLAPLFLF